MNRRRFLDLLTKATAGAAIAYSFPDVIVPKNIEIVDSFNGITYSKLDAAWNRLKNKDINYITLHEIYPKLIEDWYFDESPFMSLMKQKFQGGEFTKSTFTFNV